jgi:hypothetical protein
MKDAFIVIISYNLVLLIYLVNQKLHAIEFFRKQLKKQLNSRLVILNYLEILEVYQGQQWVQIASNFLFYRNNIGSFQSLAFFLKLYQKIGCQKILKTQIYFIKKKTRLLENLKCLDFALMSKWSKINIF